MTALMWTVANRRASCAELLVPVSDVLAKDKNGWTALMYAASNGQASCTELLVPASDALARDNDGYTASEIAGSRGHAQLASFIDAYAFALGEMSTLCSLTALGVARKKAALRV